MFLVISQELKVSVVTNTLADQRPVGELIQQWPRIFRQWMKPQTVNTKSNNLKMISGLNFSNAGFWPLTHSITVIAASARVERKMRSGPVPS